MAHHHELSASDSGQEMYDLCKSLFPICRSITGDGVRETLKALQRIIPLQVHEIPSGQQVFDWQVPDEWNLNEAYIEDERGRRIVDTANHNLHVVSYSVPIDTECSLRELDGHLHSLPQYPDLIPYRTSYYQRTWGFCLPHRQRTALAEGKYHVVVDSTISPGSLTYGEFYLPGSMKRDVLVSTHVCHPSLANDNLSGIAVATYLARHFEGVELRYGLRFVFVPGTIGAIAWLAKHESNLAAIRDGLVLSGVGNRADCVYKTSRRGDGLLDRVFGGRLGSAEGAIRPFSPYGYDERQYCSPGFNIAAGCLMRTPFGEYPEYHTSADNLDFICPESLAGSLQLCIDVIDEAQVEARYLNKNPKCEPQLGRRGLYEPIGGANQSRDLQLAQLWMLSYSDGGHSLLDIRDRSGIDSAVLAAAARRLTSAGLLEIQPD